MKGILCCRRHGMVDDQDHYLGSREFVYHRTIGDWILCAVAQKPLLMTVLFAAGLVDAKGDFEPIYWRWPFGPASDCRRIARDGLWRRLVYEWRNG